MLTNRQIVFAKSRYSRHVLIDSEKKTTEVDKMDDVWHFVAAFSAHRLNYFWYLQTKVAINAA